MNVSRPFLIGLLEAGEIEYRTVGKHRRIRARSLMEYMAADDRKRREAADELTQLNQEMRLLSTRSSTTSPPTVGISTRHGWPAHSSS